MAPGGRAHLSTLRTGTVDARGISISSTDNNCISKLGEGGGEVSGGGSS